MKKIIGYSFFGLMGLVFFSAFTASDDVVTVISALAWIPAITMAVMMLKKDSKDSVGLYLALVLGIAFFLAFFFGMSDGLASILGIAIITLGSISAVRFIKGK